jgi:hypothetical protein
MPSKMLFRGNGSVLRTQENGVTTVQIISIALGIPTAAWATIQLWRHWFPPDQEGPDESEGPEKKPEGHEKAEETQKKDEVSQD